jgi:hypothetical protein
VQDREIAVTDRGELHRKAAPRLVLEPIDHGAVNPAVPAAGALVEVNHLPAWAQATMSWRTDFLVTAVANPSYSPSRYRRARAAVLIIALLGLMAFAAVEATTVQCRNEHQRLLRNAGDCIRLNSGGCLLINEQRRQCEVGIGDLHWLVSERAVVILRKLGVPFFYI